MGKREIILQAAAVPYRHSPANGLDVLLITSSSGRWSCPKGAIEPGHTPQQTAQVETLEEAGVIGLTEDPALTHFEYEKWDRLHRVTVFALCVDRELDAWPEQDRRVRRWVAAGDASVIVQRNAFAEAIEALRARYAPFPQRVAPPAGVLIPARAVGK